MTRLLFVLVALAFCTARPAQADIDYTPINSAVAHEILVPAFSHLDETARQQKRAWSTACNQPTPATVEDLKAAYHRVADAWASLFHWSLGPITLYLRRDRFYHWPERRNSVGKGMAALLADADDLKLAPERFRKSSVAVQGLPAMERILFTDIDIIQNPWACKIGNAIAANLASISNEVITEWKDDVLVRLEKGERHMDYFSEPSDFINRVFNELATGYTILREQKLLAVMGSSAAKAKPRLLENRRSQRFYQNLELNLAALRDAQRVIGRFLPQSDVLRMEEQFKSAFTKLAHLGNIEAGIAVAAERNRIMDFVDLLEQMRGEMEAAYVTHLQLTVGFNSLDGD